MTRVVVLLLVACATHAAATSTMLPGHQAPRLRPHTCQDAPASATPKLAALRGGAAEDSRKRHEISLLARFTRWAALGLHTWAYLRGHVNSITIVSPPLPAVGKLPYTIQLPSRGGDDSKKR